MKKKEVGVVVAVLVLGAMWLLSGCEVIDDSFNNDSYNDSNSNSVVTITEKSTEVVAKRLVVDTNIAKKVSVKTVFE
jgi:hypothetical protein